jgi:hypothetical protein
MTQFAESQVFATPGAPYIRYLEKIKGQWLEAEMLHEELEPLTPVVKRYNHSVPANRTVKDCRFVDVAEILDIDTRTLAKRTTSSTGC